MVNESNTPVHPLSGLCSLFARLGGIVAPQLALLLPSVTAPYVPLLIFGVVSLIGSVLALGLPETAGHKLPESFQEVPHCHISTIIHSFST